MILSVTGHRPNKLGGYSIEAYSKLLVLATDQLSQLMPEKVLTGMALGWDTAIAEACFNLGIPFIACIPFRGQEKLWPQQSQDKYDNLVSNAAEVVIVSSGGYSASKMNKRNRYMVDNSDKVLALWDGTQGGTGNCVAYATIKNKTSINCYGDFKNV
ncbi:GTP-binding domain [Pectobacterium phage PP99]|uniref:Putative ssDNA binding protein n=1 Tax=Pectobacterium phage PP99 TaxID=1932883 RepID=A0A1P8L625_9CAUD|nr:GTP-binding domain [Pectobacterium phage PP99]APW79708.1 putative ssDNA binding protein [Pectobacterium phage PP99]